MAKGSGSKKAKKSGSNVFALFSQRQIQEFKEAFGIMDADKDGLLSSGDIVAAFNSVRAQLATMVWLPDHIRRAQKFGKGKGKGKTGVVSTFSKERGNSKGNGKGKGKFRSSSLARPAFGNGKGKGKIRSSTFARKTFGKGKSKGRFQVSMLARRTFGKGKGKGGK